MFAILRVLFVDLDLFYFENLVKAMRFNFQVIGLKPLTLNFGRFSTRQIFLVNLNNLLILIMIRRNFFGLFFYPTIFAVGIKIRVAWNSVPLISEVVYCQG